MPLSAQNLRLFEDFALFHNLFKTRALRLMTNNGDYTGALKVLEGIYALVEIAPFGSFTGCQQHPALAQMFMEEFLLESEDFIFDVGMDDVMELLVDESQ